MFDRRTRRVEYVNSDLDPEIAEESPIPTPEEAQGWCRAALALLAFAIFCAAMAARNFFF